LPFNEDKSFAGSAAFFAVGFGMSLGFVALFHSLGYMDVDAGSAAGRLAVVAAACTVAEALPVTGVLDDNISVPALALVLGSVLFH
jgi:phytol kinase